MQDFRRLRVSQSARNCIRAVYAFTKSLPADERFELSAQLRRAVTSIGLNIAEGCSRDSRKEYVRYLQVARGSGMETEFALLVTEDLELGNSPLRETAMKELISTQRQLSRLITALKKPSPNPQNPSTPEP